MASTVAGVLRRARSLVLTVPEPSDVADMASKVIVGDRHDAEAIALFARRETDRQADDSQRGVELV
jgi:hypothetical protein